MSYGEKLKPKISINNLPRVPTKPVVMLQGEPSVTWKSSEIQNPILQENW